MQHIACAAESTLSACFGPVMLFMLPADGMVPFLFSKGSDWQSPATYFLNNFCVQLVAGCQLRQAKERIQIWATQLSGSTRQPIILFSCQIATLSNSKDTEFEWDNQFSDTRTRINVWGQISRGQMNAAMPIKTAQKILFGLDDIRFMNNVCASWLALNPYCTFRNVCLNTASNFSNNF